MYMFDLSNKVGGVIYVSNWRQGYNKELWSMHN